MNKVALVIISLILAMVTGLVGCATISPPPPPEPAPPVVASPEEAAPPMPTPSPAPTPPPTPEPEPRPTPTPNAEVQILEHHLERDFLLFVRGKVKNTGDVTLASIDVTIWVEYQVEGLEGRVFRQPGSIDLEPATFKPGEVRDFDVLVQNGAKEDYDISVSINIMQ